MEPARHHWTTPAELAARLDATPHGKGWRARCPAHGGDNPTALHITEGTDKHGHPCTLLHCHAHQCAVEAICAAMGLRVADLFVIHPAYAQTIQSAPRARTPEVHALRQRTHPATQDEIALVMLADMIRADPVFLEECVGARETFWRLARRPAWQAVLIEALTDAGLPVREWWARLRAEWGETHDEPRA